MCRRHRPRTVTVTGHRPHRTSGETMQTETADLIATLSFELEKKYRHLSDHGA